MQFPHIDHATNCNECTFFDGDMTLFDAVIRGAREELNIELPRRNITIVGFCLEASSIAANFLAIAKCPFVAREIHEKWKDAPDRGENQFIPPELLPDWDAKSLAPLLSCETVFAESPPYDGRWHASSLARILVGLVHDFGRDHVYKYVAEKTI